MNNGMKAGAQKNYSAGGVDIFVWQKSNDGNVAMAQPIVMMEQAHQGAEWRPLVTLPMEAAQQLIDELWNAGLRPKNSQATDETVAALQAHIADLRDILAQVMAMLSPKQLSHEEMKAIAFALWREKERRKMGDENAAG